MPPQRPDLVLSSYIPDVELDIFVCDRLHVEADCRDSGDVLVELELVQDSYTTDQTSDTWTTACTAMCDLVLVFPAASKPSMSRRISFDPKILPIILEIWPPMMAERRQRLDSLVGSQGRFW